MATVAWLERMYQGFESSSGKTEEFMTFAGEVKRWFENFVRENECTKLKFRVGHFDISGFFTASNGQIWYFSTGDVRTLFGDSMLIRRAESYEDFRGGLNSDIPYDFDNFTELLKRKIGVE